MKSKNTSSAVKKRIQALLRKQAIARDGGCVLRNYTHRLPMRYKNCGPARTDGDIVLQAEHLVGRAHSESYGDMDNIVCLCQNHHFYFKKQHGALYWELVKEHIGPKRWKKVQKWEADQSAHRPTRIFTSEWREIEENLKTNS